MTEARGIDPAFLREPEEIVRGAGSSFAAGMRVLPRQRRAAIWAVYAYCRLVDDIVDGPGAPAQKARDLDFWDRELDLVEGGAPCTPVGRALAQGAARFGLPVAELRLVLEGMRMDLHPVVAPNLAGLRAYARRVAGAVGILSMHAFGCWRGDASYRFALQLGEAMQLTNILRDVEEDAALGRLYLPREALEAAGVPPEPRAAATSPALPAVRAEVGALARAAYRAAAREVPAHDRLRLAPALLMMGPYEHLLRRMEADWSRPPAARPGWRKMLDGARCAALAGRRG
ncbi:squalene/phytoene synthase family protein [Pseudoroseicyclus aestuarii]|uniref:Farnesyl-diphosphate farnesyltransferase n=1 Tax=Pseudoroseicyclus aestuarii TaxID=1795041 RepID=A0A318SSN4_9RHOB|nr:squalene/phytoene synthase family protein [Pseudoroseicyclus aestuarii]PYE80890.1 farnesyl-diphosphate farnesyltransferase [Pseudoroseicyclus aestuarii]